MKDNQIYFTVKDNKVKLSYKTPMDITDFLTLISTGILSVMQSIVDSAPEANRSQVKEELYDLYNATASNTLHYFAPEIEMRPHLTSQAILDAEDRIINRKFEAIKGGKQ